MRPEVSFTERIQSVWNAVHFGIRSRSLGVLKLRSDANAGDPFGAFGSAKGARTPESRFYGLLLREGMKTKSLPEITRVVDVGCRNWSYADALADFFPNARLLGVEVDGNRRYWNLRRRRDAADVHARALAAQGTEARCIFGDFRKLATTELADAVPGPVAFTFFYPFVSARPCLKWGLPLEYADFGSLLEHAGKLCRAKGRGGVLLSCHQGEWEAALAEEAYSKAGLKPLRTPLAPERFSGLWPAPYEVFLYRAQLP